MGNLAFDGINTALADPAVARGIVLAAKTALDAVTAAGVRINQDEQEFLRGIPPVTWTELQAAILGAYAAGNTPRLNMGELGGYAVTSAETVDGKVEIVLAGPYPADAR